MIGRELKVAIIPDGIDVEAGLRALEELDDAVLLERAHLGLLGWGWSMPGERTPAPPWSGDPSLADLRDGDDVLEGLEPRYLVAVRESLAVGLRNAARLLGGDNHWFDTRVATRVPLAEGGQLVFFADDEAFTAETSFTDVARLPVELMPELGRAMGVYGPDAVAVRVSEEGRED